MMMESLRSIDNHTFNPIYTSKYEQGNEYVLHVSSEKNYFIRKPNTRVMKQTERKDDFDIQVSKSLFESFVFIVENHIPLDMKTYVERFKNDISDVILKEISKQYKVLKRDIFDFVVQSTFDIPKNKDILLFFAILIDANIVVSDGHYFYQVRKPINSCEASYFISRNIIKKFETQSDAVDYAMSCAKCFELCDLKTKKVSEIKNYANTYKIPLPSTKQSKSDMIAYIQDFLKKNDINEYHD
jgi:hypothetical protein